MNIGSAFTRARRIRDRPLAEDPRPSCPVSGTSSLTSKAGDWLQLLGSSNSSIAWLRSKAISSRANEDIAKFHREILDLKTKFQWDMLQEAADVRDRIAETANKIETSQTLIRQAEVRAPNMTLPKVAGYEKLTYVLSRRDKDGRAENLPAQESDLVQPGDVVRVIPESTDHATSSALRAAN